MPLCVTKTKDGFVIFMQKWVLINVEGHDIFVMYVKKNCMKLRNKHGSVIQFVDSVFHCACFSNILRGN